jgi:CRP/FNR family transcriptional regulator
MHAQIALNAAVRIVPQGFSTQLVDEADVLGSLALPGVVYKKSPGETLFGEGDAANGMYEVISGMLRICKLLPDGRRQITGFVPAKRLIGLSLGGAYSYTAETITDVVVCYYRRSALDRLMLERPQLTRYLLGAAAQELHMAHEQMLMLGCKDAVEKIASFLRLMASQQGGENDPAEVHLPMDRHDIADYVGLTVETVSRIFTRLKRSKVIALPTANHVEICDWDRLDEMASRQY